jgi:hypothetical protein
LLGLPVQARLPEAPGWQAGAPARIGGFARLRRALRESFCFFTNFKKKKADFLGS